MGGVSGLATMEAIGLLRSGATPEAAWREAFGVDVGEDGAPKFAGDGDGVEPGAAWEAEALCAAGRLAHRSGAPLAEVLERIEDAERARRKAEAAREVALAGPRASARVLLWLPAIGWAFAVAIDPGAARIVGATPLGWGLLVTGGSLWWAGRSWLGRLVGQAERAGGNAGSEALPLTLVEAAIGSGLDVRTAVGEVGSALGVEGWGLKDVADRLGRGDPWAAAWRGSGYGSLEHALRSAWFRGASPIPMLEATRRAIVERGREEAEREAGRLGVRAALPLSLCLLPAFVVVGVLPLILAFAKGMRQGW